LHQPFFLRAIGKDTRKPGTSIATQRSRSLARSTIF